MGAGEANTAVADSGPLIHLTEIGCLSLLRIFDILHIPGAVWSETVEEYRVPEVDILGLGTIQRHTLLQSDITWFVQENRLEDPHDGERECLYLSHQRGVSVLKSGAGCKNSLTRFA